MIRRLGWEGGVGGNSEELEESGCGEVVQTCQCVHTFIAFFSLPYLMCLLFVKRPFCVVSFFFFFKLYI